MVPLSQVGQKDLLDVVQPQMKVADLLEVHVEIVRRAHKNLPYSSATFRPSEISASSWDPLVAAVARSREVLTFVADAPELLVGSTNQTCLPNWRIVIEAP